MTGMIPTAGFTENAASSSFSTSHYTIYVLPGSQYCAKVLAALDSVNVRHDVVSVSFDAKRRSEELPSGGRKVPEMKVVTTTRNDDREDFEEISIVLDSEGILKWFDENRGTNFFPESSSAGELSTRAGDGVLAGCVLYYNWVDNDGYSRSVRKSIKEQVLPPWLPFRGKVTDLAVKSERSKFRQEVVKMLNVKDDQLASEPFVRQMLVKELTYFQSHLFASPDQPCLLGDKPTAADFSVYAQLERLVGDTGDAQVFPSLPELLQTKELDRLWQWYGVMRTRHPIVFLGKDTQAPVGPSKAKKGGPRSPRTPLHSTGTKRLNLTEVNHLKAPPVTP